jgi:hypothetical protein
MFSHLGTGDGLLLGPILTAAKPAKPMVVQNAQSRRSGRSYSSRTAFRRPAGADGLVLVPMYFMMHRKNGPDQSTRRRGGRARRLGY